MSLSYKWEAWVVTQMLQCSTGTSTNYTASSHRARATVFGGILGSNYKVQDLSPTLEVWDFRVWFIRPWALQLQQLALWSDSPKVLIKSLENKEYIEGLKQKGEKTQIKWKKIEIWIHILMVPLLDLTSTNSFYPSPKNKIFDVSLQPANTKWSNKLMNTSIRNRSGTGVKRKKVSDIPFPSSSKILQFKMKNTHLRQKKLFIWPEIT